MSLQVPLYEKIMEQAPEKLRTLIASGDVYIRAEKPLQDIPDADVVCYGLWVDPVLATHHGVFVSDRKQPEALILCCRNRHCRNWRIFPRLISS